MVLPNLFLDEHIYSGLVRFRYLSGQMFLSDKRFFELNSLPNHWLRSQVPLCSNVKSIVDKITSDKERRFQLRLQHTPLAPWLLSYPGNAEPADIELSGLRNNLEENPFNIDRRWKLCPKCVTENRKQYGVAFWHSMHQLPGALICHLHSIPLHSHDELRYLHFYLPHHWLNNSEPLLLETNWQHHWQTFIFKLTKAIQRDLCVVNQLKGEISEHLNIGRDIKHTHRPVFNELFSQMKEEEGEEFLAGLFTAYARQIQKPPNILWVTLTPFSRHAGLRHPLYWLSILFWLREKLPTMRAILC